MGAAKRNRASIRRHRAETAPARKPPTAWSAEVEGRFLDHLALSANVTESAERAGVSSTSVYAHRRACSDFGFKWANALAHGYQVLESDLLREALAQRDGAGAPARPEGWARITLALLTHHRASVEAHRAAMAALRLATDDDGRDVLSARLTDLRRRIDGDVA